MENTGERLIPECSDLKTYYEHAYRYAFACKKVRGLSVLDIASGEGYGTYALSKIANKVIGVDISEAAVANAAKKYSLDFRIGSAEQIPLESHAVDAAISFETIEHLKNPEVFIKELFRVIRPGGLLIISTPNKNVYHQDLAANPFHLKELSLDEFKGIITPFFTIQKTYGQIFSSRNTNKFSQYLQDKFKIRFWPDFRMNDPLELRQFIERIPTLAKSFARILNPYAIKEICSAESLHPTYFVILAQKERS